MRLDEFGLTVDRKGCLEFRGESKDGFRGEPKHGSAGRALQGHLSSLSSIPLLVPERRIDCIAEVLE